MFIMVMITMMLGVTTLYQYMSLDFMYLYMYSKMEFLILMPTISFMFFLFNLNKNIFMYTFNTVLKINFLFFYMSTKFNKFLNLVESINLSLSSSMLTTMFLYNTVLIKILIMALVFMNI